MPIASGANGWPNAYVNKALVKFNRWKDKPPSPTPSPTPFKPVPKPPTVYTSTETTITQGPRRWPKANPKPKPQPKQPSSCGKCGPSGPCVPCGSGCLPPTGHEGAGRCCCHCGGHALYTTGVAGAGTGCFSGGMFSSKDHLYPAGKSSYALQNQGRHRCCACVTGMIIGLLLLGLILGLILALDPYLKTKQAVNDYLANNPGAYQVGDYIVVPRSTYIDYYLVNGAEDPCNPYNNASDYPNPTASNQYFSGVATTEMQIITDPALDILPDCNSLTTNIEWTYSVPITGPTTVAVQASGSSAATTSVCVVTTAGLFALNIGYCLAG